MPNTGIKPNTNTPSIQIADERC
ncbi:hypothetical protein CBM2587_A40034 [Cupriavidus taiwanensis]|uniref:Uncharacterized protein n=1 Tax=Cupriavidus taiwanensis TaxID=164546 RepID=A0A976A205_9BURK|nr:hypothetical protein CBM2587_A40034 [Cupriavidus taiwanensis]